MPWLGSIFGSYILDSRQSAEFQFESAKNKLVNLDPSSDEAARMQFSIPGDELVGNVAQFQDLDDEETSGHQGRLLKLAGCIDLESRVSVC